MPIRLQEVGTLHDLVQVTIAIKESLGPAAYMWFRGGHCGTHELLPKIMRDGRSSEQVFEREQRLVTRFRQRSLAYWPDGYPQNEWEHLFAMQHHGLSTRLLDWSENLFVAAYFALASVPSHTHAGPCQPVVWIMEPASWNKSMPGLSEFREEIHVLTTTDEHLDSYRPSTNKKRHKSPVAIYGTHNSPRIVAQRGTFVVWGAEVRPMEQNEHGTLWKVTISGEREKLFGDLRTLGFHETMIFPELTHLATELDRAEGWR